MEIKTCVITTSVYQEKERQLKEDDSSPLKISLEQLHLMLIISFHQKLWKLLALQ